MCGSSRTSLSLSRLAGAVNFFNGSSRNRNARREAAFATAFGTRRGSSVNAEKRRDTFSRNWRCDSHVVSLCRCHFTSKLLYFSRGYLSSGKTWKAFSKIFYLKKSGNFYDILGFRTRAIPSQIFSFFFFLLLLYRSYKWISQLFASIYLCKLYLFVLTKYAVYFFLYCNFQR